MNILDVIVAEHGLARFQCDHLRNMATANPKNPRIEGAAMLIQKLLVTHARLEEDLLFAALEPKLGSVGPIATVVHRDEHRKMEKLFDVAARNPTVADGWMEAVEFALGHINREEEKLVPLASKFLSASHMERLGQGWSDSRKMGVGGAG